MRDISMIILAGGKSSRMGTDKAELIYNGQSFLELQVKKAEALGIRDVVISGYRGEMKMAYPIIPDEKPEQGPLGGMSTCLERIQNDWALVLSVDAPLVPAEELEKLMAFAEICGHEACIAQCGEREFPLIGMYRRSMAERMREEVAERKGGVFAMLRRAGYGVYASSADPALFANVNDPESYRKLTNEG